VVDGAVEVDGTAVGPDDGTVEVDGADDGAVEVDGAVLGAGDDGNALGINEGTVLGLSLGIEEGLEVGLSLGANDGTIDGDPLGTIDLHMPQVTLQVWKTPFVPQSASRFAHEV